MIKAVFFDIDGTLFSHSKSQVNDSVRDALYSMHKKGILLFIATGRSRRELLNIHLDELPFDGYVALNGALCYDRDWNVIYRNPIPVSDMEAVQVLYDRKEIPVIVTQEDSSCANYMTKKIEEGYSRILLPIPQVKELSQEPAYQVTIHNEDHFVKEVLKTMPNCTSISWHGVCSDIIPLSGGKDKGLQAMMACFDLKKEEVMAFGDGDNDAVMLEAAGIGIAMGNGTAQAKAAADYVTAHIDEEGLVKALIKFELL